MRPITSLINSLILDLRAYSISSFIYKIKKENLNLLQASIELGRS